MMAFNSAHPGVELSINGVPYYKNIISLNCSKMDVMDIPNLLSFKGIECSAGSACTNGSEEIVLSPTLSSLGLTEQEIRSTVRISFCKYTKCSDIDRLFIALAEIMEEK